jgi:hypothetical protein
MAQTAGSRIRLAAPPPNRDRVAVDRDLAICARSPPCPIDRAGWQSAWLCPSCPGSQDPCRRVTIEAISTQVLHRTILTACQPRVVYPHFACGSDLPFAAILIQGFEKRMSIKTPVPFADPLIADSQRCPLRWESECRNRTITNWRLGEFMIATPVGLAGVQSGSRIAVAISVCVWVCVWTAEGRAYTFEQQQACMGDAFRLCSSEIPSVGRVTACMVRLQSQLSPGCRVYFRPEPGDASLTASVSIRPAHMRKWHKPRKHIHDDT